MNTGCLAICLSVCLFVCPVYSTFLSFCVCVCVCGCLCSQGLCVGLSRVDPEAADHVEHPFLVVHVCRQDAQVASPHTLASDNSVRTGGEFLESHLVEAGLIVVRQRLPVLHRGHCERVKSPHSSATTPPPPQGRSKRQLRLQRQTPKQPRLHVPRTTSREAMLATSSAQRMSSESSLLSLPLLRRKLPQCSRRSDTVRSRDCNPVCSGKGTCC